jgi:hypothetical protein
VKSSQQTLSALACLAASSFCNAYRHNHICEDGRRCCSPAYVHPIRRGAGLGHRLLVFCSAAEAPVTTSEEPAAPASRKKANAGNKPGGGGGGKQESRVTPRSTDFSRSGPTTLLLSPSWYFYCFIRHRSFFRNCHMEPHGGLVAHAGVEAQIGSTSPCTCLYSKCWEMLHMSGRWNRTCKSQGC